MLKLLTSDKKSFPLGFTIIEAAIATVILMVGLFAVVQIFPLSLFYRDFFSLLL